MGRARPAGEITMLHIHEVLDGELADAQAALEHRLAQTTLADLLKRLD